MTDSLEQKKGRFPWVGGLGAKAALVGVLLLVLLIPLRWFSLLLQSGPCARTKFWRR